MARLRVIHLPRTKWACPFLRVSALRRFEGKPRGPPTILRGPPKKAQTNAHTHTHKCPWAKQVALGTAESFIFKSSTSSRPQISLFGWYAQLSKQKQSMKPAGSIGSACRCRRLHGAAWPRPFAFGRRAFAAKTRFGGKAGAARIASKRLKPGPGPRFWGSSVVVLEGPLGKLRPFLPRT